MRRILYIVMLVIGVLCSSSCSIDDYSQNKSIVGTWHRKGGAGGDELYKQIYSVEIGTGSITVIYENDTPLFNRYGGSQTTDFEFGQSSDKKNKYSCIICTSKLFGLSNEILYTCSSKQLEFLIESEDSKTQIFFRH